MKRFFIKKLVAKDTIPNSRVKKKELKAKAKQMRKFFLTSLEGMRAKLKMASNRALVREYLKMETDILVNSNKENSVVLASSL